MTLYPVTFDDKKIVFVAFDRLAAVNFVAASQREWENEFGEQYGPGEMPLAIDEVALVDNYGFPCVRADAGVIAPWLGEVTA